MAVNTLEETYQIDPETRDAVNGELARISQALREDPGREDVIRKLPDALGLATVDELIYRLAEFASPEVRRTVMEQESAGGESGRSSGEASEAARADSGSLITQMRKALDAGMRDDQLAAHLGVSTEELREIVRSRLGLVRIR